MIEHYEKDVAITGIGQSEVARPSSKSAMRLTLDACLEAIADAGLERQDIDGVACWPGSPTAHREAETAKAHRG